MDDEDTLGTGQMQLTELACPLKSMSRLPGGGAYNIKPSYQSPQETIEKNWLDELLRKSLSAIDTGSSSTEKPQLPKPSSGTLPDSVSNIAPAIPRRRPQVATTISTPKTIPPVRPLSGMGRMGGFRFAPEKLSLRQVGSSQRLSLLRTASSLAAEAFVAEVERRILATEASSGERQRNRRAMARTQRCQAITAIVANLLLAWSQTPSLATSRTLDANSFTGEDIGYPAFYDAVRWLKAANLMHHRKGGRSKDGTKGSTARFWPSDQLLNLAATYGIDTGTVATDFGWRKNSSEKAPKVRETVVLKVIAAHPNAAAGRNLRIDPHDLIATTLRAEVEALNKFAASVSVEGCRPPRWQRHFRGDFRLYGRLHAVGEGNYQAMPANHRVADIRIAGEPVVEIDIGSSHLSIMHGLMRLPLPEGDLYAVPGFPRSVIKIWINATLGKGSPVRKWPKERLVKTPALADVDPLAVMAAVLGRYPWLAEPWRVASEFAHVADPKRVLPHLLMGVEAEIMLAVAQELRRQGILGLPIHDGILVPASAEAVAYKLIQDIGMREIGVTLRLDVKRPPLVPANSQPFGDFTCLAA